MEETLRILVSLGFAMLLVLLRFDSPRFGVAETREPLVRVPRAVARRRLGWYGLAVGISAAIVLAHPDPRGALGLRGGEIGSTILLGLLAIVIGVVQAALVASVRGRTLVPRASRDTPWAVGDGLATALVDEVAFRGAVLGFLVLAGAPPLLALLGETFLYALATGTARPGGDRYLLALALGIGLVGGVITLVTGGIAASFAGHAAARIALATLLAPEAGTSGADADGGAAFARARS